MRKSEKDLDLHCGSLEVEQQHINCRFAVQNMVWYITVSLNYTGFIFFYFYGAYSVLHWDDLA